MAGSPAPSPAYQARSIAGRPPAPVNARRRPADVPGEEDDGSLEGLARQLMLQLRAGGLPANPPQPQAGPSGMAGGAGAGWAGAGRAGGAGSVAGAGAGGETTLDLSGVEGLDELFGGEAFSVQVPPLPTSESI